MQRTRSNLLDSTPRSGPRFVMLRLHRTGPWDLSGFSIFAQSQGASQRWCYFVLQPRSVYLFCHLDTPKLNSGRTSAQTPKESLNLVIAKCLRGIRPRQKLVPHLRQCFLQGPLWCRRNQWLAQRYMDTGTIIQVPSDWRGALHSYNVVTTASGDQHKIPSLFYSPCRY